jgi:hypothetical protein
MGYCTSISSVDEWRFSEFFVPNIAVIAASASGGIFSKAFKMATISSIDMEGFGKAENMPPNPPIIA